MTVPVVQRPGTTTSPAAKNLEDTLHQRRARRKPSSVPQDVWELVEEMEENGGALDFTVEIARMTREYHHLEELGRQEGEILPIEQFRLRMKLSEKILTMKERALNAKLKTNGFIGIETAKLLMEGVATALRQNITDPHLIQRIGDQIGEYFRAALLQARRDRG